jgi:hypothetical protein
MPANPFNTNDPIPAPQGPLSGEAHGDIDANTIAQKFNVNPDGTMPSGANRRPQISAENTQVQPGAPAYQKGKPFQEGRC